MAGVGTTTVSGGFAINDTAGIAAFINGAIGVVSGAVVFTYPDASGQKVYIGVTESLK